MKKIAYVILHYNAFEMTCQCIDCLLELATGGTQIIVVDNNSSNDSGSLLKRKYECCENVHIIINDKNEGFAKGNNLGYKYAKDVVCADMIVVMNNDILIHQKDFEYRLLNYEWQKEVALIAPKIINRQGHNQNPRSLKRISSYKKIRSLLVYSIYYFLFQFNVFYPIGMKLYNRKRNKKHVVPIEKEHKICDVIPHGSCIIYSSTYVSLFDYAFVPITFFYGEEDILFDFVKLNKLTTLYDDSFVVYHMEKVATKTVSENERNRLLFQTKNRISSIYKHLIYRMQNKMW